MDTELNERNNVVRAMAADRIGFAKLTRMAFDGIDLRPLRDALISKVAGGNSTIIGDAKNWPAFNGRSLSGYQHKRVWLNDGAGRFVDVAQAVGATDIYDGRSVALVDLWNRGGAPKADTYWRGPRPRSPSARSTVSSKAARTASAV